MCGTGSKIDHGVLAGIAAFMLLLRSNAAQVLARQRHPLGRLFKLLHLFVPKFPLFSIVGILFLWRSWRGTRAFGRHFFPVFFFSITCVAVLLARPLLIFDAGVSLTSVAYTVFLEQSGSCWPPSSRRCQARGRSSRAA